MRGRPFQPSHKRPLNSGRKKGSPNKVTAEARGMARRLLADESYRRSLRKRLREGKAGTIEPLLWQYAYGKPTKQAEHDGDVTIHVVYAD